MNYSTQNFEVHAPTVFLLLMAEVQMQKYGTATVILCLYLASCQLVQKLLGESGGMDVYLLAYCSL